MMVNTWTVQNESQKHLGAPLAAESTAATLS